MRAYEVETERLRMRVSETGPQEGIPVVLLHGTRGILDAPPPRYCRWDELVDLDPKPPVLRTHGGRDIVVADGAAWEMGALSEVFFGFPESVE